MECADERHEHQLPRRHGVHCLEDFTFSVGASVPLDKGVYFGVAHVVARILRFFLPHPICISEEIATQNVFARVVTLPI